MKAVRVLCVSALLALVTVAGSAAAQAESVSADLSTSSTSRGITYVWWWKP